MNSAGTNKPVAQANTDREASHHKSVLYVMSDYPLVNYSFISREIGELERQGITVHRFSLNRPKEVHASLTAEASITTYVKSPRKLTLGLATVAARHPISILKLAKELLALTGKGWKAKVVCIAQIAEGAVVARAANRRAATRIHAHFGGATTTVAMSASRITAFDSKHHRIVPWSCTLHGFDVGNDSPEVMRAKVTDAAATVCVSYYTRSQVLRVSRLEDWNKVFVVRCGLDFGQDFGHDFDDQTQPRWSINKSNKFRVVAVGRLAAEKGHLMLLEAAEILSDRNLAIDLELIGDGPMEAELKRRAADVPVPVAVQFAGALDTVATLQRIRQADALCVASFNEGLPTVILEAMAVHTLVIATSVAGIPEIVKHGQTGFLVAPADAGAIAQAICDAIELSVQTRELITSNAFQAVRSGYSLDQNVRQLAELF